MEQAHCLFSSSISFVCPNLGYLSSNQERLQINMDYKRDTLEINSSHNDSDWLF